jgi:type III secretory pathway lipoprotein EscJ
LLLILTILPYIAIVIKNSARSIGGGIMAIIRKEQKEKSRNVLLRVSVPAPLMAEIKKIKKLCKNSGYFFDIKPDVISAVEKAVEEANNQLQKEKKQDKKLVKG